MELITSHTSRIYPKCHERLLLQDLARLEYGRMFWRNPRLRARLLRHWLDPRHPYRSHFLSYRSEVEALLRASVDGDDALDADLQRKGLSLRVVVREIPPCFGSFYADSRADENGNA